MESKAVATHLKRLGIYFDNNEHVKNEDIVKDKQVEYIMKYKKDHKLKKFRKKSLKKRRPKRKKQKSIKKKNRNIKENISYSMIMDNLQKIA